MDKLDDVTVSILNAANVDEALLQTLSRDDLRDLFPGPEHFLRRKRVWGFISQEDENPTLTDNAGTGETAETVSSYRGAPPICPHASIPLVKKTPKKTLQLPSPPEYVVYTDSELEQARKQYFEMACTGREGECVMSKELRCRLVRNTVTSMISIVRASQQGEEVQYPLKNEVTAMAKRLVEYYPMLQDKHQIMKHMSIYNYLQKRLLNVKSPKKRQGPTPERGHPNKRRHIDFSSDQRKDNGADSSVFHVIDKNITHMSIDSDLQNNVKSPQMRQGPTPERGHPNKRCHIDFLSDQRKDNGADSSVFHVIDKTITHMSSDSDLQNNVKSPQKRQGPTPERGHPNKRRHIDFSKSVKGEDNDADSSDGSAVLLHQTSGSSSDDGQSSSDMYSVTTQARHYKTLQLMYKQPKPNQDAVSQILDLEFQGRRAFIDSNVLKEEDRSTKILDAYPCFKDLHNVMGELQRILDKHNSKFIDEVKKRWEEFCSKVQFYGVSKKVMKPPMTLNGVEYAVALFRALPTLFPSPSAPPRKLGHASEALLHVLLPSEDPTIYLQKRSLSSPFLLFDGSRCLVAIGNTPVTTFAKEDLSEGLLYLLAYYYTLHLTYPKCVATLLSVIQTEILQDTIHERDTTTSYKRAMAEWKEFIGKLSCLGVL
ncbi:hypothetical protein UPYG_G00179440 [Umbra pygmaea]|uniref:Uncharacterized protein n=1 Tax=Umbra pygmaea TaxID=75934 RepID=A0ABD0XB96_UMBPY